MSEVLRDDAGLLTLRLRAPLPPGLAAEWRSRFALREDGGARYRLAIGGPAEIAPAIEAARAAGCEPLAIDYGRRDLEQLFMQLTDRSLRD
jgi:hypothetical protein